ncbi:asparaginase [Jannaschia ovalis]|uniref:Asparaginase n=1 Tax=Jannaschia ovalis TaxID=3038773 RepID=A0ABY8L8B2_9RHOB|nr:asparaginase [Jannaschia sp. GRR-S6-38]WGH77509.1 asparaginase [Jannaschia sp. GRR-S6-38]
MTGVDEGAVDLVRLIRGERLESVHRGHAVICDGRGEMVEAWGDPAALIYPRSACKMVQALPLVESGAGRDLTERQLAFACASHQGAAIHREMAAAWLADLGLAEADLRCGPQEPDDRPERDRLIRAHAEPCQLHNNCSGKHCGFLTLGRHLGAGPEYTEIDHPVQRAVRAAFDETCEFQSPAWGVDGCSAPNFTTRLDALGRAMGRFAAARADGDARARAMVRLRRAMGAAPELVAGERRACTDLMRAMSGEVAVKTGAEGVFVAIIPALERGIALKICDGGTRAAEATIATLLIRLGVLAAEAPVARTLTHGPIRSRRGLEAGRIEMAI